MNNNNDIINKIKESHFFTSKRFFGAIIALVFLCVITVSANVVQSNNNDAQAGGSYAEEESDEYRELLETYYAGRADYDVEKLESVADPISDSEKSYIEFLSGYVDHYDIVQVYTKQGVEADSCLVSARVKIHFKDMDSAAPGLDFFYVQKRDNGALYINNIYSSYNQDNNEFPMDPDVSSLIAQFEQQDDVMALQADIQAEYNQIMLEDSDFNAFTTDTLPKATQEWAKNYRTFMKIAEKKQEQEQKEQEEAFQKLIDAEKEQEEKAKAKEEKKKQKEEAKKAAEEKAAKEEADAYKVVTNAKVNLRRKPSTSADSLGKIDDGITLTAYREKGDWTKVKYGDDKGWIKTEFLDKKGEEDDDEDQTEDTSEDTSDDDSTTLYSPGTKVTLSNTVNVRESMSESASKVAVAYSGSTVEVVMMYEEGWTKVKYNDETGYIKSEYLK